MSHNHSKIECAKHERTKYESMKNLKFHWTTLGEQTKENGDTLIAFMGSYTYWI